MRRVLISGLLLAAAAVVLAACAAGPNGAEGPGPGAAGFWLGLWHGLISPITFVVSLLRDDVSVYEVVNVGNWYDAGFILGVAMAFSGAAGGSAGARRRESGPPVRGRRGR